MEKKKRDKLEAAGWRVGAVDEFLELDAAESSYLSMKLSLAEHVRKLRTANSLTQNELAKLIKSSQSRVAKMEAGDPSVTLDLLVKTVLALGASKTQVAKFLKN